MSSTDGGGPPTTSPNGASQNGELAEHPHKRRRGSPKAPPNRRKTACQTCRARKIKCDNRKPACAFCMSSGVECVYLDGDSKVYLDPAARLMVERLDRILDGVGGLHAHLTTRAHRNSAASHPSIAHQVSNASQLLPEQAHEEVVIERSRDYLQIPTCRTTADTVLRWPIWRDKFGADALIDPVFHQSAIIGAGGRPAPESKTDPADAIFQVSGGLRAPADERIPALIDNFLQNVHTKNPILDVEALVRHGRHSAENGLGWDAKSCLTLIACALGCVARPFDECLLIRNNELQHQSPAASRSSQAQPQRDSSASNYAKDLQLAESCFVLACRRLGLLRTATIIGAQCHFMVGVYLMYTLRPLPSWNHFYQASISYQMHLKSLGGPLTGDSTFPHVHHLSGSSRKQRRLEQSLYWSCFKSESEFRVELPLPQSEIATFEYPNMFPSPPSPASPVNEAVIVDGNTSPSSMHHFFDIQYGASMHTLNRTDTGASTLPEEALEIRQHSKKLCNEEESWYYYLTEVALRRIGNRIINTFFRQDFTTWTHIKPLISIALEFDAQVSSWSANLPDAMKQYETSSSIRAPRFDPLANDRYSSVSKELSWATDNRLLEMRSWLYQPFLYYAIHSGYPRDINTYPNASPRRATFPGNILNEPPQSGLTAEDTEILQTMIAQGIENNLKILEVRSLRHRHHGLWYDLRSIMTASLLLLALIRSGNESLIPGGLTELVGSLPKSNEVGANGTTNTPNPANFEVGGRFKLVFQAFEFWAEESPDLRTTSQVLQELVKETIEMVTRSHAREQTQRSGR